jgi:hypothetical protein
MMKKATPVFVGMGSRTIPNSSSLCLLPSSFSFALPAGARSLQRAYSTSPSPSSSHSPSASAAAPSPPPSAPRPDEAAQGEEEVTHFGFKNVRAKEKASMVGEVFHRVAANYDVMNDVMSAGVHRCPILSFLHRTTKSRTTRFFESLAREFVVSHLPHGP